MQTCLNKLKFALRHCVSFTLALALLAATTCLASATTWWVYGATGLDTNPGTQSQPFKTIGHAVSVAQTSDTITVEDGTYAEDVSLTHGGTSTTPFTLQAATGQSPLISGFVSIPSTSWSVYSGTGTGTVYTATVGSTGSPWKVRDLFTLSTHNPIAKTKWQTVSTCTGTPGGTYTLTVPSLHLTFTGGVQSSFIYVDQFHSHGSYNTLNGYLAYYITSMTDNGTTTTITFTDTGDAAYIDSGADTVTVCNHPTLVTDGYWCYSDPGNGTTVLYYAPGNTSNLNNTQARSLDICLNVRNLSYVNVTGIQVAGALDEGIFCSGSSNVNFTKCTAYDNGGADGIVLDTDTNTTVQGCVITANSNGMAVVTGTNITVKQSLICYDDEDGCDVNARSGLETNGITVEQCYLHNHEGLGHADDLQFDTATTVNALVDSSCLSFSGQNIMCGGVTGTLSNDVFLGSDAISVNGNGTWTVKNDSWLFSDYGADYTSGNSIVNSLFDHAILTYDGETSSDYNLFWNNSSTVTDPIAVTTPPWTAYYTTTLGSLYTATGFEQHSTGVNPLLTNVPSTAGVVFDTGGVTTLASNQLFVSPLGSSHLTNYFNVGDVIEINGDGVARTISAATPSSGGTTITFSPAGSVWRMGLVWDWPAGTSNLTVDTRPTSGSPALSGGSTGGERGSNINLVQFAAGEFDGTGTVNIPAIGGNITNIWTHNTTYPYYGIAP